jgi:hypothetical protein
MSSSLLDVPHSTRNLTAHKHRRNYERSRRTSERLTVPNSGAGIGNDGHIHTDHLRIVLLLGFVTAWLTAVYLIPYDVKVFREEGLSPIRLLRDFLLFLGGSSDSAFTNYQVGSFRVFLLNFSPPPQVWRMLDSAVPGWLVEALVEFMAVLGHLGVDLYRGPFHMVCRLVVVLALTQWSYSLRL